MKQKCAGCNKVFTEKELGETHWGHEQDCPNHDDAYLRNHMLECDCDLWYHPQCCPDCKNAKKSEPETKQLDRAIAFMRSLGGLYADIADDAQEELDNLRKIK